MNITNYAERKRQTYQKVLHLNEIAKSVFQPREVLSKTAYVNNKSRNITFTSEK